MRKAEGDKAVDGCRQHPFAWMAFRWGCDVEGVVWKSEETKAKLEFLKSKISSTCHVPICSYVTQSWW